jgi:hypothetical protein
MDRTGLAPAQPVKAVRMMDLIHLLSANKFNYAYSLRRTEAYSTKLAGTTKLRDGSVFIDPTAVNFKRWRQKRTGAVPPYSIFKEL